MLDMNICIGIVSYLPDNDDIRNVRQLRIQNLIEQCDKYLGWPIIIIAQNWKDFSIKPKNCSCLIYKYKNPLGITGARNQLRNVFLNGNYDYIFMMDDDMELSTDEKDYDIYFNIIKSCNAEAYITSNFLVNYMLISKKGFSKINFDLTMIPERGLGFEDWVFTVNVKKNLQCVVINKSINAKTRNFYSKDEYSTWTPLDKELHQKNHNKSLEAISRL